MAKSLTKKKVTKKAVKKDQAQIQFEKFQKEQDLFNKRMTSFTSELDKLCKVHKVKILGQGFDTKTGSQFTSGGNINSDLEREGLESLRSK